MRVLPRIDNPAGPQGFAASLDARAKIAVSVLASVMTVALNSPEAQAVLFVFSATYALSMRRPWLLLACWGIVAALLAMATGCAALVRMAAPSMPPVNAATMLVPFLRLAVMVNVVLPLAFATPLQALLASLKGFRLPFVLYMPLAVMIRFIPAFVADMKQIAEALRIRGCRLSWKQFFRRPFLVMRFVSAPLLFRALKASEDLGVAAELKGLGASRTFRAYKTPVWKKRDSLLVSAALTAACIAVCCNLFLGSAAGGMHS